MFKFTMGMDKFQSKILPVNAVISQIKAAKSQPRHPARVVSRKASPAPKAK